MGLSVIPGAHGQCAGLLLRSWQLDGAMSCAPVMGVMAWPIGNAHWQAQTGACNDEAHSPPDSVRCETWSYCPCAASALCADEVPGCCNLQRHVNRTVSTHVPTHHGS